MAARAFSFSILRSEVLSLLTSRFPADGSVDDYNYILNKNFTNFNGVSTAAISSASTTDTDRTPGTYNNVPHADNANQGSGATFNIRINSDGTATLLAVNASGSGYSVTGATASKRLTISNSVLGGGTGGDDVLLDVSSILSDPSAEIVFGRNITRNPTHRTLTAKFGDGYEQRVLDGINSKDETFTVNFANRDWTEIEVIAAFLDAKAARSFNITLQRETFKVVSDKYSITYNQVDIHSLNATFRRVYEP